MDDIKLCSCGCGNPVKTGNKFIHGHNRAGLASFTANGRWAVNYDFCIECGTTEVKHYGDGRCINCFRKLFRKGEVSKKRVKVQRWSKNYNKCIVCGTKELPHRASGKCERCYDTLKRRKAGITESFEWSRKYRVCVSCNTDEFKHISKGLCESCFNKLEIEKKEQVAIRCPICNCYISKLGQHLALASKSCVRHKEELEKREKEAVLLFDSQMSSDEVHIKADICKDRVLSLWQAAYGKVAVRVRGELIRRRKISGSNHYLYGKSPDETFHKQTYEYKGNLFKSTWELHFAEYLDSIGLDWEYEKYRYLYRTKDNFYKFYWPDFYIPSKKIFIEIKGYLHPNDDYKMKKVVEEYNIPLYIIAADNPKEELRKII